MRIQEMIDQLEKLKDEYPDHEVHIRNGGNVNRVEASIYGPELVLEGQQPPYHGHSYAFSKKRH